PNATERSRLTVGTVRLVQSVALVELKSSPRATRTLTPLPSTATAGVPSTSRVHVDSHDADRLSEGTPAGTSSGESVAMGPPDSNPAELAQHNIASHPR